MLISLGLVLSVGFLFGQFAKLVKLPTLVGMILAGILLGPYGLGVLQAEFLNSSSAFRTFALVIILARAGFSLDLGDIKKVGRPAILLSFLPAVTEILATWLIAPLVLPISRIDALLLGSVLAAVSPAIIVPRMIRLLEEGYGTAKKIPQLILAGASLDDVFVLILFTSFLELETNGVGIAQVVEIPLSIVSAMILGGVIGYGFVYLFNNSSLSLPIQSLLLLSSFFLIMGSEDLITAYLPFSGILAVLTIALVLFRKQPVLAKKLSSTFSGIWVFAEILLFVLVGTSVDLQFAFEAGWLPLLVLMLVSGIRMLGVIVTLIATPLTAKEKLFCTFAYLPKATVQAAIGAIPLSLGMASGELILTMAVLSILITAPVGAFLIDVSYKKLLNKES